VNGASKIKIFTGVIVWILLVIGTVLFYRSAQGPGKELAAKLDDYLGKPQQTVELWNPSEYHLLTFGDPIFVETDDSSLRVGNVSYIDFGEKFVGYKRGYTKEAIAVLFGNTPKLESGDYIMHHESDGSMGWVLKTMLPQEMRDDIGKLIFEAWQQNESKLIALFQPVIEKSVGDASRVIREDLELALVKHRPELDKLSTRFQKDLLEKKLLPLVREEIWPVVQEETTPLAKTIGKEIWEEVSVWRFGWRVLYDRSPLPEKHLTEQEFGKFLDEKAVPILEKHLEEIVGVQKNLIRSVAKNEVVKETMSQSLKEVAQDPDVRNLISQIAKEVLFENPKLRESIRANLESPEARKAIERANTMLDPTVIEIGRTLFGSTQTEITPEFAAVLRNKVLHKDQCWLTLHTKSMGNREEDRVEVIMSHLKEAGFRNEEGHLRIPFFPAPPGGQIPLPLLPAKDAPVEAEAINKPEGTNVAN